MSESANGKHVTCSFAQFLVSLGSSALVHLGEIADPGSGKTHIDLSQKEHPQIYLLYNTENLHLELRSNSALNYCRLG